MTSKDNSDFLQELWYKYINSTYKNKSDSLLAFLRSLYFKSIKEQYRSDNLTIVNDTAGMLTILIKQFLNDLGNLCLEESIENVSDEEKSETGNSDANQLKNYLETERGALLLYGIDFVLERLLQSKQAMLNVHNWCGVNLKIIRESELDNILATTLLSVLSHLQFKGLNDSYDQNFNEMLVFSDLNLTDYLCSQLNRTSYVMYKKKKYYHKNELSSNASSEEENDLTKVVKRTKLRPKIKKATSSHPIKPGGPLKIYEFQPYSTTELGDMDPSGREEFIGLGESGMNALLEESEELNLPYHIVNSLRSTARLLGKVTLINLDHRVVESLSVFLEAAKQTISVLLYTQNKSDLNIAFSSSLIVSGFIRLEDDLLRNLSQTVTRLLTDERSAGDEGEGVKILLGYKVIERILALYQMLQPQETTKLGWPSLVIDLNKVVIFILLSVVKRIKLADSKDFIQLASVWYHSDGFRSAQTSLNLECGIEQGNSLLRKSRISLFSLIRDLAAAISSQFLRKGECPRKCMHHKSELNVMVQVNKMNKQEECPVIKKIRSSSWNIELKLPVTNDRGQVSGGINSSISVGSSMNYKYSNSNSNSNISSSISSGKISTKNGPCCSYGLLCQLPLNTLLHLLAHDSISTAAPAKRRRLYLHILYHIRSLSFCCTTDLFNYCTKLLKLLLSPNVHSVKSFLLKLLQTVIEISFDFYRNRDECDCRFTSRHDTSLILKEIRNVCLPRIKDPNLMKNSSMQTSTSPVDLLHFVDWLARSDESRMKQLVTEHVVYPILHRLLDYRRSSSGGSSGSSGSSGSGCSYNEQFLVLLGGSVLSLLPYLNCHWEEEDLELLTAVCQKYPMLQPTFYKCLTTVLLSNPLNEFSSYLESHSDEQQQQYQNHTNMMKYRIIDHLLLSISFDSLIQAMNHKNFQLNQFISVLLKDIHLWNCFQVLFSHSHQFRWRIANSGTVIECAYIMLKQVIQYICSNTDGNVAEEAFGLLENLLCLVVDGNVVKSMNVYKGYSCELIWIHLKTSILSCFPEDKLTASKLLQSFLSCCFRQRWTVRDGLYQLRQLFLESVNSMADTSNLTELSANNTDTSDSSSNCSTLSDSEAEFDGTVRAGTIGNNINCRKNSHGHRNIHIRETNKGGRMPNVENYEADDSSDMKSNPGEELERYYLPRHNEILQTAVERADVFIKHDLHGNMGNHLDINPSLVELFVSILLSLPMDKYHDICYDIFQSIYSVFRILPWQLHQPFISDVFVSSNTADNIENIFINNDNLDLQLIILKLIMLPNSNWLSRVRLRFLITICQKNPLLMSSILQILVEKVNLCCALEPEQSIIQPTMLRSVPSLSMSNADEEMLNNVPVVNNDNKIYIMEQKLTSDRWVSLDPDVRNTPSIDSSSSTAELGDDSVGLSISLWLRLDSRVLKSMSSRLKKERKEIKKYKKKFGKNNGKKPVAMQDDEFLHLISLYSLDKVTNTKVQCIQVRCKPASGALMLQLYQRVEKIPAESPYVSNNQHQSVKTPRWLPNWFPTKSHNATQHTQQSASSTSHNKRPPDVNEPFVIIEPNTLNSFNLVGESVVLNFITSNSWNFVTVTLDWNSTEFGEITWLLNSNVSRRTKLFRSPFHNIRHTHILESYARFGHVIESRKDDSINQHKYYMGNLYIFEDPIIQTGIDNLSLMLMGLNWDGELNMMNTGKVEESVQLASIVLRMLVDAQTNVDNAANLLNKGQTLIRDNWLENIKKLTSHLMAIFVVDKQPRLYRCSLYQGSTKLCLPNQDSSWISDNHSTISTSGLLTVPEDNLATRSSVDTAIEQIGGINFVLFWLAKMVEEGQETNMKLLLKLYLTLMKKSISLAFYNLKHRGYSVLLQIFKALNVTVTKEIIDELLRYAMYESSAKPSIHPCQRSVTSASLKLCRDPYIIYELLLHWKIWCTSKELASQNSSSTNNISNYNNDSNNSFVNYSTSVILIQNTDAVETDLYLLTHINDLVVESNIYSMVNCVLLANQIGEMLDVLLASLYEPLDVIGHTLPTEITDIIVQIIANTLPTVVEHATVVKLCSTLLQLYPVPMKEIELCRGHYFRTLCALEPVKQTSVSTAIDPVTPVNHVDPNSKSTRRKSHSILPVSQIAASTDIDTVSPVSHADPKSTSIRHKSHSMSLTADRSSIGIKTSVNDTRYTADISSLTMSLQQSKVSDVELKVMQLFYEATLNSISNTEDEVDEKDILGQTISTVNPNDDEVIVIEESMDSTIYDSNSVEINSEAKNIPYDNVNGPMDSDNESESSDDVLLIQHNLNGEYRFSRSSVISGLATVLENVVQVKISDSELEMFFIQDYCFEFILHLLTNPSSVVRARALSLLHSYLYRKRGQQQTTPNSKLTIHVVSHLLSQQASNRYIVSEIVSIIFGQKLSNFLLDINWNYVYPNQEKLEANCLIQANSDQSSSDGKTYYVDSLQKFRDIISIHGSRCQDKNNADLSANPMGLSYKKSCFLMFAVLEKLELSDLVWTLNLYSFILLHDTALLFWALKCGMPETLFNLVYRLSSSTATDNVNNYSSEAIFGALMTFVTIVTAQVTVDSSCSSFFKWLDMTELLVLAYKTLLPSPSPTISTNTYLNNTAESSSSAMDIALGESKNYRYLRSNSSSHNKKSTQKHYLAKIISNVLLTVINSLFILNSKDPAVEIEVKYSNHIIKTIIENSKTTVIDKSHIMKIVKTLSVGLNASINNPNHLDYGLLELNMKFLNYSWEIISKCLACAEVPEEFSFYLSIKEQISKSTGDLVVFLTQIGDFSQKLEVIKILLQFPNYRRTIRYILLGNSTGTLCLIINLKSILSKLSTLPSENDSENETNTHSNSRSSTDLYKGCVILLEAVSLDFDIDVVNVDARNLWHQDMIQRIESWEHSVADVLAHWQMSTENEFKEILDSLVHFQSVYRTFARKNIQNYHSLSIRKRKASEFYRRRLWKKIIDTFTMEKSVWSSFAATSPKIYQLDPVEGPSRIRKRMVKRTHNLSSHFFQNPKAHQTSNDSTNVPASSSSALLTFLFERTYEEDKMVFERPIECQLLKCIEDIRINCQCYWVGQSGTFEGEFFFSTNRLGFMVDGGEANVGRYDQLPNTLKDFGFISWKLNQINLILKRRFKLRDVAFEIFMKDGRNFLVAFNSVEERDNIITTIEHLLPKSTKINRPRLVDLQQQWLSGNLTNFDYLMHLNTAAGRSYNDIMQYPVFPFILTNYSESILNLTNEKTFRNLSLPISVQNETLRKKVITGFLEKAEEYENQQELIRQQHDLDESSIWALPPYHYSSLYSNSATVLYYMIRVPPFTHKFIEFQDHEFDRPDRLFHTLEAAWSLSTSSLSCVKELIPEFFYLPEMFVNSQHFNFGQRLNGMVVNDVLLPKWANGDARLFCLIHRAALESPFVSLQLSHWIDLVFGFKQTGKAAMDALNLFHPYTYFKAICPDQISDSLRRRAVQQMIENYGQIPKQLFQNRAHSVRKVNIKRTMSNVSKTEASNNSGLVSTVAAEDKDKESGQVDIRYEGLFSGTEIDNNEAASKFGKERPTLSVLPNVIGIMWGDWVGSPDNASTFIDEVIKKSDGHYNNLFPVSAFKQNNRKTFKQIVLPELCDLLLLQSTEEGHTTIVKFKVNPLGNRILVSQMLLGNNFEPHTEFVDSFSVAMESGLTKVTAMAVSQRDSRVFFGTNTGSIYVYQGDGVKYTKVPAFIENFNQYNVTLSYHECRITRMAVSEAFSLLVSADENATVVVWDAQQLKLLHLLDWSNTKGVSLSQRLHFGPGMDIGADGKDSNRLSVSQSQIPDNALTEVLAIAISETLGDIAISRLMANKARSGQPVSNIGLFTINGSHVQSLLLPGTVISLSYTSLPEGRYVNGLAAATSEGRVVVMSSWNLQIVWRVKIPFTSNNSDSDIAGDPLVAARYSTTGREIFVLRRSGNAFILRSNKPQTSFRQMLLYWH